MREIVFLKENEAKWRNFEQLLESEKKSNPDLLAELFIELTDDLSFAKTNYPKSKTAQYLNGLTARVHQEIYKNKKEKSNRIIQFWKTELPTLFYKSQRQLLYAFVIFTVAGLIGAFSTIYDDSFVRIILGDTYVNMTEYNIDKGDPMAVYKGMNEIDMSFGITLNNIYVSLIAFLFGVFFSVGTGMVLFYNGVMLGAFQCWFYTKGLLWESATTVWLHGTLEISAIVIAGCAGLTIGNSILFPGTYSRLESFKRGAKQGFKIIIGLIPIFIVAGLIESWVTRHYQVMPEWLKLGIILVSATLIVSYFILYPISLNSKQKESTKHITTN